MIAQCICSSSLLQRDCPEAIDSMVQGATAMPVDYSKWDKIDVRNCTCEEERNAARANALFVHICLDVDHDYDISLFGLVEERCVNVMFAILPIRARSDRQYVTQ